MDPQFGNGILPPDEGHYFCPYDNTYGRFRDAFDKYVAQDGSATLYTLDSSIVRPHCDAVIRLTNILLGYVGAPIPQWA